MRYKLGEIVDITMGQSPKSEYYNTNGIGLPFLQGNRTFGMKMPTFDTYTTFTTKVAKTGDVIMSVRAPVGDVNITPVDMCLGRGICSLRMKNNNQEFLYYLMRYYTPQLLNKESGTVFGSVNRNDISGLEVDIPSEDIQQKIANCLTIIDDKIATNTMINENLEQQAQAFFNKLFPDCIIDGVPINRIIDVRDGTHDSPKSQVVGHPLITSKHLLPYSVKRNEANLISDVDYAQINERSKVECGDILISMIGTVGIISLVSDCDVDFAIKNVGLFRTSQNAMLKYYILNYLKSVKVTNYIEQHLAGSTQKYISLTELRNLPIFIPSANKLSEYNSLVMPIYDEIVSKCKENQNLSLLRDTLLPKLMNGEIDVSNIRV